MRIQISFVIFAVALLCGCANRAKPGQGDVGQFILQHAQARGGSPVTNALPSIPGRWRYSEDKDGVVIRMGREHYPAIEVFLRQAFGEPSMLPTPTSDGKLGVYRLSKKGGGIQFGYDSKATQIIVIRPMTTEEIFKGMLKATKE